MLRVLPAVTVAFAIGGWAQLDVTQSPMRLAAAPATSAAPPITVTSRLPSWRAPGATVVVRGFADAGEPLTLRASGRQVAFGSAGRRGGYVLRFTPSAPGRYQLVVRGAGQSRRVGTLLVRPLVLAAVGDITFGEQVGPAVLTRGGAYPWQFVASTLRGADVTIGNLESSVSTRGSPARKEYTFRGPPRALPPMSSVAGFDVLSLANNHAVDYGPEALLDTISHARRAGIATVGAGRTAWAARRPAMIERGGIRVGVVGYSDVNPAGFAATASTAGTARADPAVIGADVAALRKRSDVVVCFFHWGTERHAQSDGRQQLFASACLNAGAQVVLGAHPHVFGSVVRPSRRTLVAWTLGNFVFPSAGAAARTAVLQVMLERRGVRGYRLLPAAIGGFRPRLLERTAR